MCGIAALFAKSPQIELNLGAHLADMLDQLADRGPDSVGVALYRSPVPDGSTKLSLLALDSDHDWAALSARLEAGFGSSQILAVAGGAATIRVDAEADELLAWLAANEPAVAVIASGVAIEVHKHVGRPEAISEAVGLRTLAGTHALGHTRMATESTVSTTGSHPFSTGQDLCLVHNGSLSNHNALRRSLQKRGVAFQTLNDSEVAAGYLSDRLSAGETLDQALAAALEDLDGFFTFAVGSRDGFAVVRDPVACKPAIMAETSDWVALGSEYRALATLPGVEHAVVWEPEPGQVYSWSQTAVAA